ALEERVDAVAPIHQLGDAFDVGGEVGLPVVAASDGEIQHVVELVRDLVEVGRADVDSYRGGAGGFELCPLLLVREARATEYGVVGRERHRQGSTDHAGGAGDEDALAGERCNVCHGSPSLWSRSERRSR